MGEWQRDALSASLAAAFQREAALRDELARLQRAHFTLLEYRGLQLVRALGEARHSWAGLRALPKALIGILSEPTDAAFLPEVPGSTGQASGWRRFDAAANGSPLRVLAIVDEFTQRGLEGECVLALPDTSLDAALFDEFMPQLLFVESAWHGNAGTWKGLLDDASPAFHQLIRMCRERGVPTVFWNKEDPVHRDHFLPVARHFDWVFTTDADSLPFYGRELGAGRCGLMRFAAQPRLHNPLQVAPRRKAVMFAGSYYPQYPRRNEDLVRMVDGLSRMMPVDIYDRNLSGPDDSLKFPSPLDRLVVGSLRAEQVERAYREYDFAINVNTVTTSSSMLARRAFELVASGAVVVSNPSPAITTYFADGILQADEGGTWQSAVRHLATDDCARNRHVLKAMRKVFSADTWAHRLMELASRVGLSHDVDTPRLICLAPVDGPEQVASAMDSFFAQSFIGATLVLVGNLGTAELPEDVLIARGAADVASLVAPGDWMAGWWPDDWHGPDYLQDLAQAMAWGEFDGSTRACYWRVVAGAQVMEGEGLRYRQVDNGGARRSLWRVASGTATVGAIGEVLEDRAILGRFASIAEFGYCADSRLPPEQAVG